MKRILIPPPFYLVISLFLMWLIDTFVPIGGFLSPYINRIGIILIVLAILLDILLLIQFLRSKTTPNPLYPEKTSRLITSGLYRYSRNPMYLGMVIILCGWGLYLGSWLSLAIVPFFIMLLNKTQIAAEESILKKNFGKDYRYYQQQVRRWI